MSRSRFKLIDIASIVAGGWMLLGSGAGASVPQPTRVGRELACTYLAQVQHLPRKAREVRVWIPLAKSGSEQEILARQIHSPAPYTIAQDPDYGNDILSVVLEPPIPDHLEVTIDYQAHLRGAEATTRISLPSPEELQRALQPNRLVGIDDEVRVRAQRATRGRTTLHDRARGIYDFVIHHMAYDKTIPGWGHGDTRRACVLGKGNCTDFHSLFIAMARADRIPARFKIGVVIPQEPTGIIPGYHCWAEFYTPTVGWVPVDASEAWKHPAQADYYFGTAVPNRFLVSMGRDIQLVPRQQGQLVNIFFAPYVEADGQEFSEVHTEVRFQDLNTGAAHASSGAGSARRHGNHRVVEL